MVKIALSFICGAVVCSLIIIGVKPVLPAMADAADNQAGSENATGFLTNLIPDFKKIYRDALTSPFISAESKIYDEDIAGYYRELMVKTGLTNPDSE